MSGFAALVLAGSREGAVDPVAAYGGATHKALIKLGGRTLLCRVAVALRDAGAARICVVSSHPDVRAEAKVLDVEVVDEQPGPSLSVAAAGAHLGTPLLVTTADHALLEGAWVSRFLADVPTDADVAALVAARATVEAAAPGTQRTWIKLTDGHWSGCNLFYFANARSLAVVDLWRRVEAERKHPWRQARILGTGTLFRYAFGMLSMTEVAARLGARAGVKAAIVQTPYGLAAVDVDKPADLDLVRGIVGA